MVDNIIPITAGTGTSVRTVTNAAVDSGAHQQVVALADAAGNLLGTAGAPFPVAAPADVATTGTLAALNAAVPIATGGRAVTAIQLSGTWVGTVQFQGTTDPAATAAATGSWYPVNAPTPTQAALGSTTTANGLFRINSGGYTAVRAIFTAYTSGSATVWVNSSAQSSLATLAEPATLGAGTNTIGQLTPSTLVVTATGAAAIGTATLPAAGAGLFHYITNIRIERFLTAAATAAATVLVTGGANHGLIFNLPNDAAALGTQSVPVDYRPTTPLRSTAANTATTVTTPAVTATTYRITVTYYTAA